MSPFLVYILKYVLTPENALCVFLEDPRVPMDTNHLDLIHAEIKSMRTSHGFRRKGVAAHMMKHILSEAEVRRYK